MIRGNGSLGLVLLSLSCASARPSSAGVEVEPKPEEIAVYLGSWLRNRERPWFLDWWGLSRGSSLETRGELSAVGDLRVEIHTSHAFSGTELLLEIRKRVDGELQASATVREWSDCGPDIVWKKPTGFIVVDSADWARAPGPAGEPRIIEIRLHDNPMRIGACAHGVVEIP